ncbi:type IVB secretion system protein IcmH/DotU [Pseudomonas sp. 5S4]|nr:MULTISPECIES: type IVB secretion system protein IcmH/DotU [unclassified Pseudomonas]MEA9979623.1 type IVB secretion system protein IcmH/DotU [Pseudomonas sp. RTS4]MEB0199891.1 type IVB secretion system protein IcmH/DotU [Pseudomonas sp. 5S4]MEB0248114.1 type IVB secretion system protein IcmH/DotU [Pseudomonas sp. 10S5]
MNEITRETGHVVDQATFVAPRAGGEVGASAVTDKERPELESVALDARQTFSASVNPLVAAASAMLSKLVEIKYTKRIDDPESLKKEWERELGSFHPRALSLNAESHLLDQASYVLCTALDEAAVRTQLPAVEGATKKNDWSATSLLYRMHKETFGGEKFFVLLSALRSNPVKNLDLLELMYLCLALEFQGKYHSADKQGEAELNDIRDGLYRTIRHLRGDAPRELSPHWHGLKDQRRNLVRIVPWWLVVLFTWVCLTVMYSGFAWVLNEQRETVLEPYRQLDSAVIQPWLQDRDA